MRGPRLVLRRRLPISAKSWWSGQRWAFRGSDASTQDGRWNGRRGADRAAADYWRTPATVTRLGSRAGCPEPFSLVLHAEAVADSPVVALREPDLNQRAIDSVAVEENSLFAVVSW